MGDPKRNKRFSEFIFRNFPPKRYKSVLVVADGKGELSLLLSRKYKVRTIEAKPRQKHFRKRVNYTKGWFDISIPVEEDFIVGMHPDDATGQIVRSAAKYNKRWAVVPCCLKGVDAHGVQNFTDWIRKLKSLSSREVREALLPIGGKNLVLWSM